jgi:hypothetical protein
LSDSYYNRPWRGHVEIASLGGEWVPVADIISVEDGKEFLARNVDLATAHVDLRGSEWRIVDVGGNIYEHGTIPVKLFVEYKTGQDIPDEVTARQRAYYDALFNNKPIKSIEDIALEMAGNQPHGGVPGIAFGSEGSAK